MNTITLFLSESNPERAPAIVEAVRLAWCPADTDWATSLQADGSIAELSISHRSVPGVGAPGQALIERLIRAVTDANGGPCRISAFVGAQG